MGEAPSAPRFPLHGLALRDPQSSAACQTSHLIPVRRTCVGLSRRVWLLELGVFGGQAVGLSARVGGQVKELLGPVGFNAQTEGVVLLVPGGRRRRWLGGAYYVRSSVQGFGCVNR